MRPRNLRFRFLRCPEFRTSLEICGSKPRFLREICLKFKNSLENWTFFCRKNFFPIFFRKFVFYAYRVYNLARNIRGTLVLTKYKLIFFLSILVPITTYISPQNLRFFEICGVPTVPCPNHYITITLIFATWFLRYSWRTQCPQKSGVWCISY